MPKKYNRVLNHYTSMPWALEKNKLAEIQGFILRKAKELGTTDLTAFDDHGGDEAHLAELGAYEAKARPSAAAPGDIQVINVYGVIAKRMDMFMEMSGGSSVERISNQIREAVNNPNIKAIVLNIDSPGGSVFGIQELGDLIYSSREKKHLVAVANDMAASAAYWIGSAADELVMTPSGMVGSIGVYTIHEDWSKAYEEAGINPTIVQAGKYKTEGNYLMPLSEEARQNMQESVDFYYDAFITAVARGRGVTPAVVKKDFGQGRVLNSKDAKAVGMVDRIDTLEGVLQRLGATGAPQKERARAVHHTSVMREVELLEK